MSAVSELVSKSALTRSSAAFAALVIVVGSTAIVAGAWFFQYVLLIQPCPLCLEQRKFHYAAIALALIALVAVKTRAPRPLVLGALGAMALILLVGAGVAIYHSGVEWKFWAGPQDCSGPMVNFGNAGSLLEDMDKTSIVRCDQATRYFGVSLANANIVISLVLAAVAAWGIRAHRH